MDELKIETALGKKVVGTMLEKSIAKKYGVDLEVKVNNVNATMIDGEAYVHIDMEGKLDANRIFEMLTDISNVPGLPRRGPK